MALMSAVWSISGLMVSCCASDDSPFARPPFRECRGRDVRDHFQAPVRYFRACLTYERDLLTAVQEFDGAGDRQWPPQPPLDPAAKPTGVDSSTELTSYPRVEGARGRSAASAPDLDGFPKRPCRAAIYCLRECSRSQASLSSTHAFQKLLCLRMNHRRPEPSRGIPSSSPTLASAFSCARTRLLGRPSA